MRIVTSLLHANYKENLMTRFSANKQNKFQRPVYIYSCCHGNGTYISLTIKKLKFVLLTCLLPFLMTEGSRVLEKKVHETQLSKTVFSHLKWIKKAYCLVVYRVTHQDLVAGNHLFMLDTFIGIFAPKWLFIGAYC